MHILYIHQYFTSRSGATGTRSYEFSKYLIRQGHRVTMLTSGVDNPAVTIPSGQTFTVQDIEGIQVVGVRGGYNDPKFGTKLRGYQRMWKFYEFARVASCVGRQLERPDVVLATHTPLPIGLAGMALKKHFRVPFVFEVRDLWPEALTDAVLLSNRFVIWWLRRLANKIYKHADHIITLSPGMKAGILSYGIPYEKISVIPNASDLDLFKPENTGDHWRQRWGVGDRFIATYFGAMGLANGLDYVIEAARLLEERGRQDIVFVLIGDGGQRSVLREQVKQYDLQNVIFQDPLPRAEIAEAVGAAQACLTIFRPSKTNAWSPNKMFDSLAAGRTVLINVPGWLGDTITEHDAGLCLDAHDPHDLANALMSLADDPQQCAIFGDNARALAEREFDRMKLVPQFEDVLLHVQDQ